MNSDIIINRVRPFLDSQNTLGKKTFRKIFYDFSQLDLIEIINILSENNIFVRII